MTQPKGVGLFCTGGSKDGEYIRISEETFRWGRAEFAVEDGGRRTILFDAEPAVMATFRVERYLLREFVVNKRRLVFLVAEDVSPDDMSRRIVRHLAAMAGMDKAGIRRRFWLQHARGYLEMDKVATRLGRNAVHFLAEALECYLRSGHGIAKSAREKHICTNGH